jgi:diguanylate cyclase (GGDEF)-like protein
MEDKTLQEELEKTKAELSMLYEIGNAMHTTLKLDEILYIILTGVTAHAGLGFNRAMLFLVNESDNTIEGKIGIGPDTGEEADRIWKQIEAEKTTLDDLIGAYKRKAGLADPQLNRMVKEIKISLNEKAGIIALTALDGMPLHIKPEDSAKLNPDDPVWRVLKSEEVVTVPLKTKDKVIGVILADNPFTKEPITKDDMRMLTMFANQAGLAIENSRLYEQTVLLSNMDSLTRLWNHGYFQYLLEREIERAAKFEREVSLIMMDIDNFKNYNDALGHRAGDKVLQKISEILKESSRKTDFVCRYGGEEFAIILPDTAKSQAHLVSEKLRLRIEEYPFEKEEVQPNKNLTLSSGVATFPQDATNKEELISRADSALYEAKKAGRNRSCVYQRG